MSGFLLCLSKRCISKIFSFLPLYPLNGICNLVQLYAVFTFKQIIKELAPHGCESSNLQILTSPHHHITTSPHPHNTAPNPLKGSCNLVKLYAVFTFKRIIKELAPHGCKSSNLQILKSSNSLIITSHITTSLPHLWYIIYPAHGIVVDAAR